MGGVREFETGATRSPDVGRYDPEGFFSPLAMEKFDEHIAEQRSLAWAAGLFEGEGCITEQKTKSRVRVDGTTDGKIHVYPRLSINLTDEDVIRRFAELMGGKVVGPYAPRGTGKKQFWSWVVQGGVALSACKKLFPYLGMRRKARLYEVFGIGRTAEIAGYSPLVVERYCEYMNDHRKQSDGSIRDSDNWQKGLPLATYMKGGWRHFLHLWKRHRGFTVNDPLAGKNIEEDLCALLFNVQGYLHEVLKSREHLVLKSTQTASEQIDGRQA